MYVEQRQYQLLPGRGPEYLRLYEAKGLVPQTRYLPVMLGYYLAELGELNEIQHMWLHTSLDEREANRARMRSDPDFQTFWAEAKLMIVKQTTRIWKPADFFVNTLVKFRGVAEAAVRS
jgi:hypothetical protein